MTNVGEQEACMEIAEKNDAESFAVAVREIFNRYAALIESADTGSWIKLWDPEGVQMPPGSPMRVGTAAIEKGVAEGLKAMQYSRFRIEIVGTFVDRIIGFAYGNYGAVLTPRTGGETIKLDGKYETIFRKRQDGTWKIFRDCFNSNSR